MQLCSHYFFNKTSELCHLKIIYHWWNCYYLIIFSYYCLFKTKTMHLIFIASAACCAVHKASIKQCCSNLSTPTMLAVYLSLSSSTWLEIYLSLFNIIAFSMQFLLYLNVQHVLFYLEFNSNIDSSYLLKK